MAVSSCLILFFGYLCIFQTHAQDKPCNVDGDCLPSECCERLLVMPIASRRQVTLSPYPDIDARRPGKCAPYIPEGGNCNDLMASNGYCSCAPGLHCQTGGYGRREEDDNQIHEKRDPASPTEIVLAKRTFMPGYCSKHLTYPTYPSTHP